MEESRRKVLVVEDEVKISSVIKSFLESKGFFAYCVEDGLKAVEVFNREVFSMILLDLMLPGMSGEEVCRTIRQKSRVPIIMLTSKSAESDMLQGLDIGADDYITKPFSFKTLFARMEAVWRRSAEDLAPIISMQNFSDGYLEVDLEKHIIRRKSEEIKLTPNEYKILTTLMKNPHKVFTRDELISSALGEDYEGYDRTIDSHIKNLRAKLEEDPKNPMYVRTIHSVGYKFGGE